MSKPWWKKHLTQMQLVQFFLIVVHNAQLLWQPDCGFPMWTTIVIIPQNLFMVILFGDFYYKTYVKKPIKKSDKNGISTQQKEKKQF